MPAPDPISPNTASPRRFRVALSFSGAQLNFVQAVAEKLKAEFEPEKVFFYPDYLHETNGIGRLDHTVPKFYLEQADLTAVFISASYEQSNACMAEWRAVRELIYIRQHSRLLLFRFDQTPMDGLHSYDCYTDVPGSGGAEEIAQLIIRRWRSQQGLQEASERGAAAYLDALRAVIGERALGLLKSGPLSKLRSEGGFMIAPQTGAHSPDVSDLVSSLHRATDKCFVVWRQNYPHSLDVVRRDCQMLLGELLKLCINVPLSLEQGAELAFSSPQQLTLACDCVGSAVTAYCAWNDLPLLFTKAIDHGFDVAPDSVIDLEGLVSGVGSDVSKDIHEAAWLAVQGKASGLSTWLPRHIKTLKSLIELHWNRDRKGYLLVTGTMTEEKLHPAYPDVTQALSVGLVIRSADGLSDLMRIDETALVALILDYLKLLETL